VYSPSHSVETAHDGTRTHITGEWSTTDRDFSLLWTRSAGRVALNLLTAPGDDGDGYFLLLAAPDPKDAKRMVVDLLNNLPADKIAASFSTPNL